MNYSFYIFLFILICIYFGAGNGWRRWRRLWKGWIVIPTGIGVSVLTVLQWRRIGKDSTISENTRVNSFQITCYRAVPFRALSRAWGWLSSCYVPVSMRGWLYTYYAKIFNVNIDEAAHPLQHYNSLCEFFVRSLRDGTRPVSQLEQIVSPADGNVITAGLVTSCSVEQIKGVTYTIHTFLGEASWYPAAITYSDDYFDETSSSHNYNNNNLYKSSLASKFDKSSIEKYCRSNDGSSSLVSPQQLELLPLGNENATAVLKYNSRMLGWLIFYFRFCITDLLKHSFYFGFQLIYGIKSSNILVNDKVFNGASSFLKSQFNFKYSNSEEKAKLKPEPEIYTSDSDDNGEGGDGSGGDITALCDPYWEEYKKKLLHNPTENQLYQFVIYLAPGDYHRFHSPVDWNVKFRRHFQGELLSVNPKISKWIPELFSLNERAVYVGEWQYGFFSMTAVGATNVGSIRVYNDKDLQTNTRKWRTGNRFQDQKLSANWKKGEEIGEFRLGSTIVLLFEAPKNLQISVKHGDRVKVGQAIISALV